VLLLALVASGCGDARAPATPRNLILFVIDTLRADRVSAYGNDHATTPNLDAFAREAILFENAFAPSFHTAASHASLFTSTYPATHGVWNAVTLHGTSSHPNLAPASVTLAETLRDAGFQTAAMADGGWVTRSRGLLQGFDVVDSANRGANDRIDAAVRWLQTRQRHRRFFLFLHTYEVHAPYVPPEGQTILSGADYDGPLRNALAQARAWRRTRKIKNPLLDLHRMFFQPHLVDATAEDIAFLLALYDTELTIVDQAFGRLMAQVEAESLADDTLIIVTADHGEEFFEHGKGDHQQLYDEVLHIPLMVRDPRIRTGARRADLVDLVDLMPTALTVLGIPVPATSLGRAIDLGSPHDPAEERLLIAENDAGGPRWLSVRGPDFHAVFRGDQLESVEAFDVDADPEEHHDISRSPRGRAFVERARTAAREHDAAARSHRNHYHLGPQVKRSGKMSDRQRDELRMLGYIE